MHAVQAQHMHCSDRLKTGSLKTLDFNLNFTGTLTQLFTSYRSWGRKLSKQNWGAQSMQI